MDDRWRLLGVLTLARAAMGFQFQAVASVSPFLQADLGFDNAQIGFLVGLYLLPGIVFALPGGLLGARFGDRRIVLFGLAMMLAGALIMAGAGSFATAVLGRAVTGVGAVLLNVLVTKLVADRFAGRDLVLAMSFLVNSWPIGIGLALWTMGALAGATGWQAGFIACAGVALVGLLAMFTVKASAFGPRSDVAHPARALRNLSRHEWALLAIAAGAWSLFNAAFAVVVAFLPAYLLSIGHSVPAAGAIVGVNTFLVVVSVQLGGVLAHRQIRPDHLVLLGIAGWAASLIALPWADGKVAIVVAAGLVSGLPAGPLIALPAEALQPSNRGPGMGAFYTLFYVCGAVFPLIAGWLLDRFHHAAAPVYLAAALMLACLPLLVAFRRVQRRQAA